MSLFRHLVCTVAAGVFAWTAPLHAATQIIPLGAAHAWEGAEFRIAGAPVAENNFDPDQIRLDAIFTGPSGETRSVAAFWYQDYTRKLQNEAEVLTPQGTPEWRLRYTPTEAGEHRVTLHVETAGAASQLAEFRFNVVPAATNSPHGWVRIAADQRTFATTDGRSVRLVGENVCWPGARGLTNYEDWFDAMQRSGQNFARLWMAPWWAGLEHNKGTLNHYPLDAAWQLDQIFALAETRGLYLLLCFDHHGMYMANDPAWGGSNNFWILANPYAHENGGPCVSPNAFFTDPQARALYQKRLRYLIARYGGSPRLLAWQFFNEIDNAYIPRSDLVHADVVAWHRDMARWLRAHDPYQHLITTSLTGGSDRPEMWQLPEMEFSMYHSYWDPAPARKAAVLAEDFHHRYGKPVMIGEFGVSGANWARPMDPHLRGFRQGLWGGALGGSVGTAMTWWWEDVHADRVYSLYAALHQILAHAGWDQGRWRPLAIATAGVPPFALGEPTPDRATFNAPLALNTFRRTLLSGEAAIADPLAAERSSEFLSTFLRGQRQPAEQRPLRVLAWFGENARLVLRVDSVASEAELVVSIDGEEKLREKLGDPSPLPPGQSRKIDREFTLPVPAGRHQVEIANAGSDWLNLESARLEGVRPSGFSGGWKHGIEAVGLRQDATAVVYLNSPWVTFPAGQHRYQAPLLQGETLTLHDWPAGRFRAEWFSPETAASKGVTEATTADGRLAVPIPDFDDDLAVVITPLR
ncbi:DUF5060 domain-containing protein [Opitutus terrae]|uniref:mannan endo-1,4-beta-mannosidase n=1 Tax=Opitutus terrae (strain DSM 11246 / JCM 15787 / PB90-1) TaxID=452637 RepID=B1ZN60_OPITP|nr:DUF5060 domain-containing protein [Opitutus terrae]ACB73429.1 hypothetical protein Oter_0138 [Opitutus terrae PB90-1]